MARRSIVPARAEGEKRLAALAKVASRFKGLQPAVDALKLVRAVPTCFLDVDRKLGIGGYPIDRFGLLHGPSNHGKTAFALGLVKSFLQRDHYALYIDAERTTPFDWVESMLGSYAKHPLFLGRRPDTYEQTREEVRAMLMEIVKAKDNEEIPQDAACIIIVDSLKRLVPSDLWKQIFGLKKPGEKASGLLKRMGQVKAAMNSAWLDELIPLIERAGAAVVAIAREMENTDGDQWTPDYKVGGGKDVFFDSSLAIRVERAAWVRDGEGSDAPLYGQKHVASVYKTKIAGRETINIKAYFHTSNGVWVPEGFDRARDVIHVAKELGVVDVNGSWFTHGKDRIGQGEHKAVKKLTEDVVWLDRIEKECRAKFSLAA